MDDLISRLSELRCQYNCFDENERDAYHTLSEAIKALSDVPDTNVGDTIDRQAAITAICEDGTWLESQGCTEITMCERKQRDVDILSELPTIDAVPVIRCKDCVHYKGYWYCETWNNSPGFPAVTEDGFCNMAERRADVTTN